MVNDTMRAYLVQAYRERAGRRSMTEHQAEFVLGASFRLGVDGFSDRVIWRALELATAGEGLGEVTPHGRER